MHEAAPAVPGPRRTTTIFIFVTVVLDVLALGIIIPVAPKLTLEIVGGSAAQGTVITGLLAALWALMQFVFSPILGALSDRVGRRPVILLANVGLAATFALLAVTDSLALLIVARVLSGACAATISTAGAYIADVTPPERRAAGFGLIGAAFGLGFVLGPALGGQLGAIDLRLPFWVAAGFCLANAAWGLFVLPESLPPDRRSAFTLRKANPVAAMRLLARPGLPRLALVLGLVFLAHESFPAIFVLHGYFRHGWDEATSGYILATAGIFGALVQGGLTGRIVARFGAKRAMVTGLIAGTIGFTIYGLAPSTYWFLAGVPLVALWGLAGASLQGMMSTRIPPTEQGVLQGGIAGLRGVLGIGAPLLYTAILAVVLPAGVALTPQAGAPPVSVEHPELLGLGFLMGAALLAVAVAIGLGVRTARPGDTPDAAETTVAAAKVGTGVA